MDPTSSELRDRSPALPSTVQLNATVWNCGSKSVGWDQIPTSWTVTSDLDDANLTDPDGSQVVEDGYKTIAFRDTVHAVYSAVAPVLTGAMKTPPSNLMALQALSDQLSKDWWSWRLVAYDRVYNGIIAPDLDGYTDEVTFTYTADRCDTRVKTAPWDADPENFNHSQPSTDCANCVGICAGDDSDGAFYAKQLCLDPITGGLYFKGGTGNCCCPPTSGYNVIITGCYCQPLPTTLTMTSSDETCNFDMFQSCTINYGPTPPEFAALGLGDDCYLSTASFPDPLAGGAEFRYFLGCDGNQFFILRVYAESPFGSPYKSGQLYTWLIGAFGNACLPLVLSCGQAFPGSDASCCVTITDATVGAPECNPPGCGG